MKLSASEVLTNYIKLLANPVEDKIVYLRNNKTKTLVYILRALYNPNIRFNVTSIPKYKKDTSNMPYETLDGVMDRIYLFEIGNPKRPKNLTEKRQTEILIQMLESLSDKESEILEAILLKNINYIPYLNVEIAAAAFPGEIV